MAGEEPCYKITITDASKDGEVVKFTVQAKLSENEDIETGKIVFRQYEDFEYLVHCLTTKNDITAAIVPSLPQRPVVTAANTETKVKSRQTVSTMVSGDEYFQDCKRLQRFLQDIADHPLFKEDDNLTKFLTEEEPPVRAAVKKGLLTSLASIVDNARFHHRKDVDEQFQNWRDNTNVLLLKLKQCQATTEKMLIANNACSAHYGIFAMACRNSATFDIQQSKTIVRCLGQFSDALDSLLLKYQRTTFINEDTIGLTYELYCRYVFAAQEMLFRRTCKLVELENATKALEKAKPKNKDQLQTVKEKAEKVFKEVSEQAKIEFEDFTDHRIQHFKDTLIELADRHIENHRETCELLSEVINDLKMVE